MSKINLFVCISIAICSLSSCIPIIHTRVLAVFKNCTNDTVYIGVSHYDNIDSIEAQLAPCYDIPVNSNLDTAEISLWEKRIKKYGNEFYADECVYAFKDCYIYPDSTCAIDADCLSNHTDTCYFFLIKWKDAKQYSWDEIRSKKLFRRWIVTSDKEGRFDRNIRYPNDAKY